MRTINPHPAVAGLAESLLARVEEVTDETVQAILKNIDFYRAAEIVKRDELRSLTKPNVEYILGQLSGHNDRDLVPPRETGRIRAEQGAPLPDVLHAYRVGFARIWEMLLEEAKAAGVQSRLALLESSNLFWEMANDYAVELTESYRRTAARRLLAADRRRSALVAALTAEPGSESRASAWELARFLGFPYEGNFLVVVAETPVLTADPLPGLEDRLRSMNVASAWRSEPDHQIGVLSCGRRRTVSEIVDVLRDAAAARVGVSPLFPRLDRTPRAAEVARIALQSLPGGERAVRQLDYSPLDELVMSNLETTREVVTRILGDTLTLSDRATLLATAEAWMAAHGSAAEAGRALFCHENTVRYRLRKLEEHLGRSLDDPMTLAELATALIAIRTFPTLLEDRPQDHRS